MPARRAGVGRGILSDCPGDLVRRTRVFAAGRGGAGAMSLQANLAAAAASDACVTKTLAHPWGRADLRGSDHRPQQRDSWLAG